MTLRLKLDRKTQILAGLNPIDDISLDVELMTLKRNQRELLSRYVTVTGVVIIPGSNGRPMRLASKTHDTAKILEDVLECLQDWENSRETEAIIFFVGLVVLPLTGLMVSWVAIAIWKWLH